MVNMQDDEDMTGKTRGQIICWQVWTIFRKILSACITLGSLGLIFYAIGKNYAALPGHPALHYVLFIFVLILLGYLEGLQIAILEMERSRLPTDAHFKKRFKKGIQTWKLATGNNGMNVRRFLIGRQFFVVFVVFLCAQLTTYPDLPKKGWPNWLFTLVIETGLPGALVVLAFGQLMPQLIAATHPMRFMNLWFSWSVVALTLALEFIGIAHFAWVLSWFVKLIFHWGKVEKNITDLNTVNQPGTGKVVAATIHNENTDTTMEVTSAEAIDAAMFNAAVTGTEEVDAEKPKEQDSVTPPWLTNRKGDEETLYHDWGYNNLSGTPFPGPKQIVDHLVAQNKRVPRYLLPPTHKMHIPPHVVAYDLLNKEDKLEKRCAQLEAMLNELQGKDHTAVTVNGHSNAAMEKDN